MVEITDFLTAAQWIATVSLAFIAISYVEKFTILICQGFFAIDAFFKREYNECISVLPDESTLNNLKPHKIDDCDIAPNVEGLKRKVEIIRKKAITVKEKENDLPKRCMMKSIPSVSLFIAVFCSAIMFLAGIEHAHPDFAHYSSFMLCTLSILYIIVVWVVGEGEHIKSIFNFSSLRHASWCFFILLIISLAFGIFYALTTLPTIWIDKLWWYMLLASLFLSCLNLIIYPIKIRNIVSAQISSISKEFNDIKKEGEAVNDAVKRHLSIDDLKDFLQDNFSKSQE